MILPNPIRLAVASAAFGAGVAMIAFGALKGAHDIIKENEQRRRAAEAPSAGPEYVADAPEAPHDASDDYSV